MPRPTKLTPERQARACRAVELGATFEMAARYAGITYACWRKWVEKGNQGRQPYVAFLDALKDAEARAVVGWLSTIEQAAADGEWTAAAWKLERRYPAVYGRRLHEITGTIEVHTDDVRDRLAGRLDELAQRRAAQQRAV